MESLSERPHLIEGGSFIDDRGQIIFANNFQFKDIKRFYLVENFSTQTIRAFHGHLKEKKYVLVISGTALLVVGKIDDFGKPIKEQKPERFILSSRKPSLLYIPPGYANGFRSLEPGTKIIFFSNLTLEESKKDDYRIPYDFWGKEIWEVENR